MHSMIPVIDTGNFYKNVFCAEELVGLFELVALRESKNGGSVSDEGGVMSCPACGQRFCEDIGWIVLGGYPFGSNLRIFEDIVLHKHFFVRDVTGPVAICCA